MHVRGTSIYIVSYPLRIAQFRDRHPKGFQDFLANQDKPVVYSNTALLFTLGAYTRTTYITIFPAGFILHRTYEVTSEHGHYPREAGFSSCLSRRDGPLGEIVFWDFESPPQKPSRSLVDEFILVTSPAIKSSIDRKTIPSKIPRNTQNEYPETLPPKTAAV